MRCQNLLLQLSLVLKTLASQESFTSSSLLHSRGSFLLSLKRSNQRVFNTLQDGHPKGVFNKTFADAEIRSLPTKYKLFRDIDSTKQPDLGKYHAPPTPPAAASSELPEVILEDNSRPLNASGPSPVIQPILVTSGTARVPLSDDVDSGYDILYQAGLSIGTPPQIFAVDVDTGSADLWVPSSCPSCANHKQYDPRTSTTSVDKEHKYSIAYGSGNVNATLTQDVVTMQGLTIQKQSFGRVDSESPEFQFFPNDGLIGMAFGSIALSGQPTFFENLIEHGVVARPHFSLYLTRGQEDGSELCLGCINLAKAIGPVVYVPVVSRTYWTLNLEGMTVDNAFAAALNDTKAAIDSGTTFIYAPVELVARFYSLIQGSRLATEFGSNFYAYPCDLKFTISIVFGGERFSVDLADFNLGRLSSTSSECIGGIIAIGLDDDLDTNLAIIGDELLKSWVTVFDYSNGARVGFAPSINNRA